MKTKKTPDFVVFNAVSEHNVFLPTFRNAVAVAGERADQSLSFVVDSM